ncbi:hypothetical protein ABID58_007000 [Bradyrhizobium sp. S3.2.6]
MSSALTRKAIARVDAASCMLPEPSPCTGPFGLLSPAIKDRTTLDTDNETLSRVVNYTASIGPPNLEHEIFLRRS